MRLPELSNFACLPSRAGGSPRGTSAKTRFRHSRILLDGEPCTLPADGHSLTMRYLGQRNVQYISRTYRCPVSRVLY